MSEQIQRMYIRLRSLLRAGNVDAPHIQTEIADIRRNLALNGQSAQEIEARTAPGVEGF